MPLRTAVTLGIPGILGVLSRTAGTVIEGDTQNWHPVSPDRPKIRIRCRGIGV